MDFNFLTDDINLIFDYTNIRKLSQLLNNIPETVHEIDAAIAFTTVDYTNESRFSLVSECIKHKIKLNWWGLFNQSEPSTFKEIELALNNPDYITFYPYAKNFHAKVIYFHGFGIYIGSHNISYNALRKNIEAGIFIKEEAFTENQSEQINNFFDYLKKDCINATIDDLSKIKQLIDEIQEKNMLKQKLEDEIKNKFHSFFPDVPIPNAMQEGNISKKDKHNADQRKDFIKEWNKTNNIIGHIKTLIKENCKQPSWVSKDANDTVITDQILHAYYYSYILKDLKKDADDKKSKPLIEKAYRENKKDPIAAIMKAIKWWESLDKAPTDEDKFINIWGVSNLNILNNLKTRKLTRNELITIFSQNHAAKTYAIYIPNKVLGKPENYQTDLDERVMLYVDYLLEHKSKDNLDINDVLKYLLFDTKDPIEDRVYNCVYDKHYKIERLGKSILGEIIGWGIPDKTHIRNDRVNKALRCLGYDINLY